MSRPSPAPSGLLIATPVPVVAPGRLLPLHVRIAAPAEGDHLPVVVFSHGAGSSGDDCLPLTHFWASHGFVVVSPTHLDNSKGGYAWNDPRLAHNWRQRPEDLSLVIDALPVLVNTVPGLAERVDASRIVIAGHSMGAYAADALIGAQTADPQSGAPVDMSDPRVLGAVLLAPSGDAGREREHLIPEMRERLHFLDRDWSSATRPSLTITGTEDVAPTSNRDWRWRTDTFVLAPPGHKALLVLAGAGHDLGGVTGRRARDGEDADPDHLRLVLETTLAFMRALVDPDARDWEEQAARLEAGGPKVENFQRK